MKRVFVVVVAVILMLSSMVSVSGKTVLGKKETEYYVEKIAAYIIRNNENPGYGSSGGEWAITGLARSGHLSETYKAKYLENLAQQLEESGGILHQKKYTEYSRVVIALTSLGLDATNFDGYNLVSPLAEMDSVAKQGANGVAYALIALDCGNYDIPNPKSEYGGKVTTRNALIEEILKGQTEDGGWNTIGTKADVDVTAMVIQALAPYYQKDADVKRAVDEGLKCLSNLQLADGGFARAGTKNCESTAQILTALSEMNINMEDSRFVKSGNTVLDGLFQYYKDGGFCHLPAGSVNEMATEQALYALVAYDRSISGDKGLYEIAEDTKLEAKKVEGKSTQKSKTAKKKKSKKSQTKMNTSNDKKKGLQEKNTNDPAETSKEEERSTENSKTKRTKKKKNNLTTETVTVQSETVIETKEKRETIVHTVLNEEIESDLERKNTDSSGTSSYGKFIIGGILFIGLSAVVGYSLYKKRKDI